MKHTSLATTVLGLLTDVFRYQEIAGELGISLDTVREYARRIYTQLHGSSRTEAVLKYMGGTKNDGRL